MTYPFQCRSCSGQFEVHATLQEKERGLSPTCPDCGSGDVRRVFTPILMLARGSDGVSMADPPASRGGGCGCGGACTCGP